MTTWPFTPMLAVAGRGRVIEIYLVGKKKKKQQDREFGKGCEVVLYRDRTITGHGLVSFPEYLSLPSTFYSAYTN